MTDTRRFLGGLAAAVILVATLTACAPDPSPTPAPSTTPSVSDALAMSPTPTPTPTPTPDAEMTGDEAAAACLTIVEPTLGTSVITGEPQIHARAVDPRWLILFPAENEYGVGEIYCVIGGDPADPDLLVAGEKSTTTPEELARKIASNDEWSE